MKPRVSVIMPAYNAALYIGEAIQSILNQTFTDFELIIINDGSIDTTLSVIQSFSDKRIRLCHFEKNQGIIAARNYGLELAEGEYIAKMDADDISLPSRFQQQVNYLDQHPEVAVLATKLAIVDASGFFVGVWPEDYYISHPAQIQSTLPRTNCIGQPTVMMRAHVAKTLRYNKKYQYNEDWGMWLDVLSKGWNIAKLDEVLLHYRVHATSTTVKENASHVELKTLRFRTRYLVHNLRKWDRVWRAVLRGCLVDVIRLACPNFILKLVKLLRLGPLKILISYWKVRAQLQKHKNSASPLFFFPYYHSGGAEKVHAGILETVSDKKPLVFITDTSRNSAFLMTFKSSAELIETHLLLKVGLTYRWMKKKIRTMCEQNPQRIVFGCNSRFYYELIPDLPESTAVIDLIHAFVHEYEDGPEKWSLALCQRINKRVIISENTRTDFKNLYAKHKVDAILLQRIQCISNGVEIPEYHEKPPSDVLQVLYVGRGSSEKRIHLISGAAKICALQKRPVLFHFVGDVESYIPESDRAYCRIHGEIQNPKQVKELYAMSHALIIASSREGFPMVIMEAMAQGVIPIATDVGGISSHVQHLKNGFLIDEKEEEKIPEAVVHWVQLLIGDPQKLKSLSKAAYEYAAGHFKKEVFFNSYRKLLS